METKRERIWLAIGVALWLCWLIFVPTDHNKPHEGDPCGPHHRWTYVYAGIYGPDLSCESVE